MTDPPPGQLADPDPFAPRAAALGHDDFALLTDVLLPCLLFAMLGALVWFLLDMVAARFEAPLKLLRLIVFFFMLAVVGIARIRRHNSELSAGAYGLALVLVMGLFTYLFSFGGGAFGGGYGGRHPTALMLLLDGLVVAIWFGAHYLVEQTAIDPDDEALQTAGILSSDDWATHGRSAAAIRKRPHPGRAVMVLSLIALGVFGGGHRLLAGHPSQSHAFWCMVVYLGSAMLVLALSSLTGLELYLRGRGVRLPGSVIALWLLLAVPLAAGFLTIAHAAPKLEPRDDSFLPKVPAWLARFARPDREAAFEAPWLGDSPPAESPDAYAEGGQDESGQDGSEPGQEPGESAPRSGEQSSDGRPQGQAEGGAGEAAGEGDAAGEGGEGNGGQAAGGGESTAEGQTPAGEQPAGQADEAQQPGEQPSEQEQPNPGAEAPSDRPQPPEPGLTLDTERFVKGVGLLMALLLLAAILWQSAAALRGRWTGWQAQRREAKAARPLRTRDPFTDPFAPRSPFLTRPAADTVVHVYRALLAYCELLGKPRRPEHTAHEFLYELPAAVESWRPMIVTLTELYEAVEYTPERIGDEVRDELRPIWERLMQAVREVRR